MILNTVLNNENLSYGARGLMAYVLTHYDEWVFTGENYFTTEKDKLSKIKGYLKELMQFGYLKRYQEKGERGIFGKIIYIFYELPKLELPLTESSTTVKTGLKSDVSPKSEKPITVEPTTENQMTDETGLKSKSSPKTVLPLTDSPLTVPPLAENHTLNNTNINNTNIYSHWNSKKIIVHKSLTKEMEKAMEKAIKKYSEDEIVQAIDTYSEILNSNFYFNHKWSLIDFLNRKNGISTFMEEGSNKANYESCERDKDQSPKQTSINNNGIRDFR